MANSFSGEKSVSGKVLIINREFPPAGGPAVQRVVKFVRYLPEEGWTPTVICGNKSAGCRRYDYTLLNQVPADVNIFRLFYRTIEDYSALASAAVCGMLFPLRLLWTKEKIIGQLRRAFLKLVNLLYYIHPEPSLSWVYLAVKKARQLHKRHNFDVIVTSGPPHITHMVGFMLRRLHQVKWVADFRDPWVDCQMRADKMGFSRRLDRFWEQLVLENADRIITVSPSWAELLACKLASPKDTKVSLIYSGYDPDDIPDRGYSPTNPRSCSDALHIHYNGTIQSAVNPDIFFKAVAELKKEIPYIHRSLSCTFTGLPANVVKLANNLELNEIVRDVGPLSHRKSLEISISSDVLLLILSCVDETTNGIITSKVYEYVAMGKNILAIIPMGGDLHTFLKDYQQCHIVDWNNLDGIVEMLKSLMARKRNGQLNSFDPPNWISQYTRQAQTRRLARLLEDLVQNGP